MSLLRKLRKANKNGLFDAWHDHDFLAETKDSVLITGFTPELLITLFEEATKNKKSPAMLLEEIGYLRNETP